VFTVSWSYLGGAVLVLFVLVVLGCVSAVVILTMMIAEDDGDNEKEDDGDVPWFFVGLPGRVTGTLYR
jgi:hypothetical protein